MENVNDIIPPGQLHGVTNSALKALERLMKNLMHGSLSKFLDDMLHVLFIF